MDGLNAQRFPLVRVHWEDSSQPLNEWCDLDDVPLTIVTVETVGWLIASNDKLYAVAQSLDIRRDGDEVNVMGVVVIPRRAVLTITPI